jgi:hypothetical protein
MGCCPNERSSLRISAPHQPEARANFTEHQNAAQQQHMTEEEKRSIGINLISEVYNW